MSNVYFQPTSMSNVYVQWMEPVSMSNVYVQPMSMSNV